MLTPDHGATRPALAIMAVLDPREHLPFLEEWLGYHILQGVGHFYLYNNLGSRHAEWGPSATVHGRNKQRVNAAPYYVGRSDREINEFFQSSLLPFIHQGLVTVIRWKPTNRVGEIVRARDLAIRVHEKQYLHAADWTAFIDLDEYLDCEPGSRVATTLQTLTNQGYGRVLLPEKCYGPRVDSQGTPLASAFQATAFNETLVQMSADRALVSSRVTAESGDGDSAIGRTAPTNQHIWVRHYKYHPWELPFVAQHLGRRSFTLDSTDSVSRKWDRPVGKCVDALRKAMTSDHSPSATPKIVTLPERPAVSTIQTPPLLTIGIPVYDDFDGVYFTVQAFRMFQDLTDTEILILDNYGCERTEHFANRLAGTRYVKDTSRKGSAAARDLVMKHARGRFVLCCDAHVVLEAGVVERLKAYFQANPDTVDLIQGPLLHDTLAGVSTHFEPRWASQGWGVWAHDARGDDPNGEPFEIQMHSMGALACRRDAWPGINPMIAGFGGDSGYVHEKFRRQGGRVLCVPYFRWIHRFASKGMVRYWMSSEDILRNYLVGHLELGLDISPVLEHFSQQIPPDRLLIYKDVYTSHFAGNGDSNPELSAR